MSRPTLTERVTIRLPEELLQDLVADASRRSVTVNGVRHACSVNEVILNALENDLARRLTYRLDYYADLRPAVGQEATVTLSDKPAKRPPMSPKLVAAR